ncbi:MAG: nitronate monooxygenase [Pseudomonadota bacterium]
MFKTRICELLGIEYPIIQAPMNWISGADLVAAVSRAGGLGTLGPNAGQKTPSRDPEEVGERLRGQIRKVKSLTDKPFAVNISASTDPQNKPFGDKYLEVSLEEKVAVAITIMGHPRQHTKRLQEAGIKVLHCVTTPRQAHHAQEAGVDAIVSEGYEGGGHIGNEDLTTLTLVPQIVDKVKLPLIAGGGIGDARGFLAMLALGAEGVYMGTRFLATSESDAHPDFKEAVVRATNACTLAHGKTLGGGMVRQLKNKFSQAYIQLEMSGGSPEDLVRLIDSYPGPTEGFAVSRMYHSFVRGDVEEGIPAAGQVSSLISKVESAGDVIRKIIKDAADILAKLNSLERR